MKKRSKMPRPRAGGAWTESRFWSFIRSALRLASRKWPPLVSDKDRTRRRVKGVNRVKYEYRCEGCLKWFPRKEIQVDHVIPCGSLKCADDLPGFVSRLFCEADGFQVLCSATCHAAKTAKERLKKCQSR